MKRHLLAGAVVALATFSCESVATVAPLTAVPSVMPAAAPELMDVTAVKEAAPEVPETPEAVVLEPGRLSVGTFYAEWFFDAKDDRSALANKKNARTQKDWGWKLGAVSSLLAKADLDIVAILSVGGPREISALVEHLRASGGPDYNSAWVAGEDRFTSQQVVVLSKLPISNVRRLPVGVSKHVAVDVELPHNRSATVVAAQLRSGSYPSQRDARLRETQELAREVDRIRQLHPVVVLGDLGSMTIPGDVEYMRSAPALLASRDSSDVSDDCVDSAEWYPARGTTVKSEARDRLIICDLPAEDFSISGREFVVVGEVDPPKAEWSSVRMDERDMSDHYLLRGTVLVPPAPSAGSLDKNASP